MGWYLSRTLKQLIVSCTPNLQVLYIILPPKVINSHTNGDKARQGNTYSNVLCHNQKDGNQSTHVKYKNINIRAKKQKPNAHTKERQESPKIHTQDLQTDHLNEVSPTIPSLVGGLCLPLFFFNFFRLVSKEAPFNFD